MKKANFQSLLYKACFAGFLQVLLMGATPAMAQMGFGAGQGGQPGGQGAPPQRTPQDESQKIREKAGADDQDGFLTRARPSDAKGLYDEGVRFLEKGYYTRSQEYFERIRIRFPFSQYATLADLRMGEVYFDKGEHAMAVQAFRDFRKLHPSHEETHYAVYMMAKAELEQAPNWSSRDQSATIRALEILDGARPPRVKEGARFEDRFPESPYASEVEALRVAGRERLARNLYHIGRFYQKRARSSEGEKERTAYAAAAKRFEDITVLYPNSETVVEARAMQVICLVELGEVERAHAIMAEINAMDPDRWEVKRAKRYLDKKGTSVASATTEVAAETTEGADEGAQIVSETAE